MSADHSGIEDADQRLRPRFRPAQLPASVRALEVDQIPLVGLVIKMATAV
jgi:hypothetical protein